MDQLLVLPLAAFLTTLLIAVPAIAQTPDADGARTLLLVDDAHVLYRPGTERVLNPLTRHAGNPVIPRDRPWEGTIAYCSVHRDVETGH